MLRIMTLNLNYTVEKHGKWEARRELIKEVIGNADPHIISFQAVAKEQGTMDQASQLAELLPEYKHLFFQPAQKKENGREEGSAIISKIPFAEKNHIALTLLKTEDPFSRVLLKAGFDLPKGRFYLFNGHFSWVGEQAERNISEALGYMKTANGMAVLAGDLNTPPDSELFGPFQKAGWTDAWNELRNNEEGFTFESDKPFTRIDYFWANTEMEGRLKTIEVLHKEKNATTRLSDHKGLLLTLDIKI